MLEYRDEETNEKMRMLIDKAKKIRVTPLKKAILLKRQKVIQDRAQRREEKRILKQAVERVNAKEVDESGFVTIDEGENLGDQSDSSEKEVIQTKIGLGGPCSRLGKDINNIPYQPIFSDMDKVFVEVSQELLRPNFNESIKMAEKVVDRG